MNRRLAAGLAIALAGAAAVGVGLLVVEGRPPPPACDSAVTGDAGPDPAAMRAAHARALDACLAAGDVDRALRHAYQLYSSYWAETRYREALEYAELALEHAVEANDQRWQQTVLMALFAILTDIGDLAGAEAALRRADDLTERSDAAKWAYVRSYYGVVRKSRGELAGARSAFRDVLSAAPPGHPMRSDARFNLIEVCLALGDVAEAQEHLDAVVSGVDATDAPSPTRSIAQLYYQALVARARGDLAAAASALERALHSDPLPPDWAWEVHHQLAGVRHARGDTEGAVASYQAAIAAVESLRAEFAESELKEWLLAEKRAPYEGLFAAQVGRGEIAGALGTAERAKARSFLDAFIAATARRAADGESRVAAAERADSLRALLPSLRASPVVEPRPVDEVARAAAGRHVLLYFAAESRLWLARIASANAGDAVIRALEVEPGEVADRVQGFLADPDGEDGRAALTWLGDALVPRDLLPDPGVTLYVVTDGVLGEIPFAALVVGDRYLVADHDITYVPSLNALGALSELSADAAADGRDAVVLGDPGGDLPRARSEAEAVAGSLGAAALVGAAADRQALRGAADARVLHLATHAGHDAQGAWVELADGKLHAGAVLDLGLHPRLVVLATCLSASRRGRGMWGSLGAAFLAAGSQAVLATLWSVDDEAARRFVLRFYGEGGADRPVAALARAQRASIAAGAPPSGWAPFVVFGTEAPAPADQRR